ncbi:MAG: hypothetical protein L6Q97_13280 [Thermoanaerobaculia bacterium]|nr:hypothetical protein [Thermoanaerobaculia bacterium]
MKTLHCNALQAAGIFFALALQTLPSVAQSTSSPLGKTDFAAFYTEAPLPPSSIAEAARRAYGADWRNPDHFSLDNFYKPFNDKVERAVDGYKQHYANKTQAYYGARSEATLHAQAAAQANQNPVLASMGGVDKVSQMSEAEARAAANKAAAEYMADPFAANGVQSDGMTALYQKIISDPAYAARFEKMSEKEKEAELRKYMANDKPQVKTPAQMEQEHRAFEQQTRQSNKVKAAMEFQQAIADFTARIYELQSKYVQERNERLNAPGNHTEIEADYSRKYAQIPEVVYGEYGRDKDIEQLTKLKLETATRHQAFAAIILKQDVESIGKLKANLKSVVAEYTQYFHTHKQDINGNMADQMQGTETESLFANFEMGLLGLAQELAKYSRESVQEAAQWEKNLQETKSGYGK